MIQEYQIGTRKKVISFCRSSRTAYYELLPAFFDGGYFEGKLSE